MFDGLQFLELSLRVPDVIESLNWYRELGLIEHSTNDIRDHRYAVVGNGDFCIGLHDQLTPGAALTFVHPNLAPRIRDLVEAGAEFERAVLGADDFHETLQIDADGTGAILLEARTFSPSHDRETTPITGPLAGLILPCLRLDEALAFWQSYGFFAVESAEHATLHMPRVAIELRGGNRSLTLRFKPNDYASAVKMLQKTHELRLFDDDLVHGAELRAPEGTLVQLISE